MLHFVYETTNLINGKKYIGKHSTENIDDKYLGSGLLLVRAIEKYGKGKFQREILKEFDSEKDAYEYEKSLITEKIIKDNNYYNIMIGGYGVGCGEDNINWGKPLSEEHRNNIKIANSGKNSYWYGRLGKDSAAYGNKHTDEAKKKISISKRGENAPRSKLTEFNVIDIKKKIKDGVTLTKLSKIYNVTITAICDIKNNRSWRHVII
jgi:hypothetical protein